MVGMTDLQARLAHVRWELDRLALARMSGGGLDPGALAKYDRLVMEEGHLLARLRRESPGALTSLFGGCDGDDRRPAGWYGDPFDRHEMRYWDGGRWTRHVGDHGEQMSDPPPGDRELWDPKVPRA